MRLCDWHLHTRRSPCGHPDASYTGMTASVRAAGIQNFGFTDHLHSAANLPDLRAARKEFDALPDKTGAHFAVEVSCLRVWDLDNNLAAGADACPYGVREGGPADGALGIYWPDEMAEIAPEYAIGGAHWPLGAPLEQAAVIRSCHRQNMFLAQCPEVAIVAHPWWWMGAWQDEDGRYTGLPWLADFRDIPTSMHEEFAAALRENGKRMELNAGAIFLNAQYPRTFAGQYLEYVVFMKSEGVRFSLASDCHEATYRPCLDQVGEMLEQIGLGDEDLWAGPA
jgi:histidinol phosphatase-like PHP family hydrolase